MYNFINIFYFYRGINYMTGYEMFEDVKQFMDFGPPGVEVHCLHGDTIPTLEKYAYFIISYLI